MEIDMQKAIHESKLEFEEEKRRTGSLETENIPSTTRMKPETQKNESPKEQISHESSPDSQPQPTNRILKELEEEATRIRRSEKGKKVSKF